MSDYIKFDDPRSKTVITCTVKNVDRKSTYNNKTANECNKTELINEVFRQLKLSRPDLPNPTVSLLSPEMFKNERNGKWDSVDTAFFYTKDGYKPSKSAYDNLHWVGTHNGNSNYSFTSFESAMENAIALLNEIEPNTQIPTQRPITIRFVIAVLIAIVLIFIVFKSKIKLGKIIKRLY